MSEGQLSYKGYTGSVCWSEEDSCWHGKIQGIADLVTYEGDFFEDLEVAFKDSVVDYEATQVINFLDVGFKGHSFKFLLETATGWELDCIAETLHVTGRATHETDVDFRLRIKERGL